MSLLALATKGKIKKPYAVVIFGPDGVGKSTFGAGAPNPIFLGPEDGSNNMDVTRLPTMQSWLQVEQALTELANDQHDFKTLVVDSLDWIEPLLHQMICKRHNAKTMAVAAGGYGKAYDEALDEFIKLKDRLNELRDKRGMNVVLIAHAQVVTFNDPQNQMAYERYEMKLHKKASALFREYADAVLFANYETFVKKEDNKVKAYGDGARVMHTERRPGFDAKNRLGLPFTLDLSWEAFVKAAAVGQPESPEAIMQRISLLKTQVADAGIVEKIEKYLTEAKGNVSALAQLENRLKVLIGE